MLKISWSPTGTDTLSSNFVRPFSYSLQRCLYLTGPPDSTSGCQSALVDELGFSPSRYHHTMIHIAITRRWKIGLRGRSSETLVSHHHNQSTNGGSVYWRYATVSNWNTSKWFFRFPRRGVCTSLSSKSLRRVIVSEMLTASIIAMMM
jgi:hypothetical protein